MRRVSDYANMDSIHQKNISARSKSDDEDTYFPPKESEPSHY